MDVQGPDGVVIQFPEGTSHDVIKGVMAKRYSGGTSTPAGGAYEQPAPPPGVTIHNGEGSNTYIDAKGKGVPETEAEAKARAGRDAGGTWGDTADAVLRGLPFVGSFFDRARAGTQAKMGNGDYAGNLSNERAAENTFDADYPWTSSGAKLVGGAAGTVAAAPLAGEGMAGSLLGLGGKTVGQMILRGGAAGAAQGAAQGAGSADDLTDTADVGKRAITDALIGGGAGVALSGAVAGGGKLYNALANRGSDAVSSLSPAAQKYARQNLSNPDTVRTAQQRLAELGPDAVLADTGQEWGAVARGSAAMPGVRNDIVNPLLARDAGKNGRLASALNGELGPAPVPSEVDAGIAGQQQALGPRYGEAIDNAQPPAPPPHEFNPQDAPPEPLGAFPGGAGGKERKAESLGSFVARNGGIPLDDEAAARDLGKVKFGGYNVARDSGKSIDGFWREKLAEAGYFPPGEDGYASGDITKKLYDALEAEQRGKKLYPVGSQTKASGGGGDEISRAVEKEVQSVIKAHVAEGVNPRTLDYGALQDAGLMLQRGEEVDPMTAYERALTQSDKPSPSMQPKAAPVEEGPPSLDEAPTEGVPGLAAHLDQQARTLRGDAQKAVKEVRGYLNTPGTKTLDESPRTLLETRQAIDGKLKTEANPKAVWALTEARDRVDAELAKQVPGIKDIDGQYAELARQRDALARGATVLDGGKTAPRPSELAAETSGAANPQGTMVGPSAAPMRLRQGVRAELDRIVGQNSNDVSALQRLVKGEGDWNREKLRTVFGQEKADKLLAVLDREQEFQNTKNFVVGGSPTAMTQEFTQFMKDSAKPGEYMPKSATVLGVGGHAFQKMVQALSGGREEAARQAFAQGLGRLSVAQGPEREAILNALLSRGTRAQNVQRVLAPSGAAGALAGALANDHVSPFARR